MINPSLDMLLTEKMSNALVKVDLGCGNAKPEGFIGVDCCQGDAVDIISDLSQTFPFADNSVDWVRAYDCIEHLPDRIHTMNEIWRICKDGALVDLLVPSTDGRGAFQDPTHVSFWNINSFQYFSVEAPGYLALCQRYGFRGAFSIISLDSIESARQVIHVHAVLQVIKDYEFLGEKGSQTSLPNKSVNIIVFPDWEQPEEYLFSELRKILFGLSQHPESNVIALFIDASNLSEG